MKVLIDNKEFILNKTFNSFGEIMNKILKKLKMEDRTLETIIVDGVDLETTSIVDISKVHLIEIFSKSHTNILYESLLCFDGYAQDYFKSLKILEAEETDKLLYNLNMNQISTFLFWTLNILCNLKESTYVEFLNLGYNELLDDFKKSFDNYNHAIVTEDYDTAVDILEFEISDIISALRENVENYKKELLIEEDSSNHAN